MNDFGAIDILVNNGGQLILYRIFEKRDGMLSSRLILREPGIFPNLWQNMLENGGSKSILQC